MKIKIYNILTICSCIWTRISNRWWK